MALPKEPRQKMINMMYLVLTALLALNVSSEILNAFKTVNNSIGRANAVIGDKNSTTYKSFEDKLKDEKTAKDAAIWKPKADQARALSADMDKYIEDLKKQLKVESGLTMKDGVEDFKEDNLEASTRLMGKDQKGEGKKLLAKLTDYRNKMLAIIPEMKAEFDKSFPLDVSVPKAPAGTLGDRDWETAYFHMTPTIAALTILSKFQNDVKNTEAQIVDYCHSKVGAVVFKYDQFAAIANASSTYLFPGQDLEITAGVGAFSTAAKPTIIIGGSNIPVGPDGTAVYKTKAEGSGTRTVDVTIEYVQPDGTRASVKKPVTYTIGVPSGAAVSPDKMNVFYAGVANPITVSSGAGAEKTNVSAGGGASLSSTGTLKYNVTVGAGSIGSTVNINVSADGRSFSFPFRVKKIPDPRARVGNLEPGRVAASTFRAQGGVFALLENFDFEGVFYKITSFKVYGVGKQFAETATASSEGNTWGGAQKIITMAGPGSSISIDEIRAVGPDGTTRKLPAITYILF
jgi:gliding motility-associated protein GldM